MSLQDMLPYILGGTGAGIGALNYFANRPQEAAAVVGQTAQAPVQGPQLPTPADFGGPQQVSQPQAPRQPAGPPMAQVPTQMPRGSAAQQTLQLPNQQQMSVNDIGVQGANLSFGEMLGQPSVWGALADLGGAFDPYNRVAPIISQRARGQVFQNLLQQLGSTPGGGGAQGTNPFLLAQLLGR